MNTFEAVISGSGLFTPPNTITNDELVESFNLWVQDHNATHGEAIAAGLKELKAESSAAFIEKASGIQQRFVMDKAGILDPKKMHPAISDRNDSDPSIQCEMALQAAHEALDRAGRLPSAIDMVIVACSNLQRPYPAMAVELQHYLGAGGFGYDMNVACSSATFGLQAAASAVQSGSARCVLVVNPEICTGHLNFRDRDSHFIFGDACTAAIVEREDQANLNNAFRIRSTKTWTQYSNNIRNNFGFLNRCDESGIGQTDKLFVQNGRKVFKEVCPAVAEHIHGHLQSVGIKSDDLKRLWLHQANLSMNQLIGKKVLGRVPEPEEAPVILDQYANTSSAGSMIAFHKHSADLNSGDRGIICSFGAGYSIGSVILEKI
ncbi:beta-ketoacyl-ACP synthase III [Endozoicomonas sp. (ex Bugula neritina AB1)]|nr:beta-ketoacyl-ACP synthase III [Endozoicomonas sp. (ex Bugula neritina AB1)]